MKKKPFKLNDKLSKVLSYLKYVVLLFIVIMYFLAYSSYLQGKSPWDVFSMIVSFNFRFDGYTFGIIALAVIMVGMFFIKRFFCRFLCPMGAVFSLLPSLPFTAVTIVSKAVKLVKIFVLLILIFLREVKGMLVVSVSNVVNVSQFVLSKIQVSREKLEVMRFGMYFSEQ